MKKLILLIITILILSSHVHADTVTFQDGLSGYTGTTDTSIHGNAGEATTNYGTDTTVGIQTESANYLNYGLLKFDLSSIPSNASVSSAVLSVYLNTTGSSGDKTLSAYRVFKGWNESQATWNIWTTSNNWGTAGAKTIDDGGSDNSGNGTGADRKSTAAGTVVISAFQSSGFVDITITSLVQSWVDTTAANNGMMLSFPDSQGGTDAWTFSSSENATSANRPKLVVTYTIPQTINSRIGKIKEEKTYEFCAIN